MRNFIFPSLIALGIAGTLYAMSRAPSEKADAEGVVKLPVAAAEADKIAPWLNTAARELGHSRVRAYDGSVFIDVGDDSISFFKDDGTLTMHVGVESKYRHARKDRAAVVKGLEEKGQAIYEHALQLRARAESREQVASTGARPPAG